MSINNRNTKQPHTRRQKHKATCENLQVRALIDALKENWDNLSLIERGERLHQLITVGCTTRGLEDELGRSDTAIRRNMKIAALPEQQQRAVQQGASAKKVLAARRDAELRQRMRERIDLDAATGTISDAAAEVILQFCRYRRITSKYVPQLLSEAIQYLSKAPCTNGRIGHPRRSKLTTFFRDTRPRQNENEDRLRLDEQGEWLANILRATAPEEPIYTRAINQAETLAEQELRGKSLSPIKAYKERARRLAQLSDSPPPRRY